MTKPGYTHIIVSRDLHKVLKERAESRRQSIAKYIEDVVSECDSMPRYGPPEPKNPRSNRGGPASSSVSGGGVSTSARAYAGRVRLLSLP